MLKRLIPILLLLLPIVAWAQDVYVHPASGLHFPASLENFERIAVRRYDDPKLGVQVAYGAPGLGKADFYVFDFGLSQIPDGINSDFVRSAYSSADRDVQSFAAAGKYLDLEHLVPLGSVMRPSKHELEWYVAAYKFRTSQEGSEPLVSWLLVTGYRNQFLKVRFSHLASRAKEGRVAIDALVQAFWNANSQ